jgi:hypothetical protein
MARKVKSKETKVAPSQANEQGKEATIRGLAYQFFCQSGYQHGKDQEHWLEAEHCVLAGARME